MTGIIMANNCSLLNAPPRSTLTGLGNARSGGLFSHTNTNASSLNSVVSTDATTTSPSKTETSLKSPYLSQLLSRENTNTSTSTSSRMRMSRRGAFCLSAGSTGTGSTGNTSISSALARTLHGFASNTSASTSRSSGGKRQRPTKPRGAYHYYFREQCRKHVVEGQLPTEYTEPTTTRKRPRLHAERDESPDTSMSSNGNNECTESKPMQMENLGKTIAQQWRELSPSEQRTYQDRADEDARRYEEEMERYYHNTNRHVHDDDENPFQVQRKALLQSSDSIVTKAKGPTKTYLQTQLDQKRSELLTDMSRLNEIAVTRSSRGGSKTSSAISRQRLYNLSIGPGGMAAPGGGVSWSNILLQSASDVKKRKLPSISSGPFGSRESVSPRSVDVAEVPLSSTDGTTVPALPAASATKGA